MKNINLVIKQYFPLSIWIPLIFATGSVLRVQGFSIGSLWYDEAFNLVMTRLGLFEMVRGLTADLNPPTWYIFLWFITRLFGSNEFSARIISVLASIAILILFHQVVKAFHLTPKQQTAALIVVAFLPYQLWMAQDSKIYAVFSLLFLFCILSIIKGNWLGLAVTIGLMLWGHNTAILFLPALFLFAWIRHPNSLKAITIAFGIGLISWLPWASIVFQQSKVDIPWFLPFSRLVFGHSLMTAIFAWGIPPIGYAFSMFIFLASITWASLGGLIEWILYRMRSEVTSLSISQFVTKVNFYQFIEKKKDLFRHDSRWQLALLIIFPLLCFIIVSIFIQNVFIYRTVSPITYPLVLWLAIALLPEQLGSIHKALITGWICILFIFLMCWSPSRKSGNFEQVFEIISLLRKPGDAFYHTAGTTALHFWYYLPDENHYLLNDEIIGQVDVAASKIDIPKISLEKVPSKRVWVVWSRTPIQRYLNPRVNLRMEKYTRNCQYIGKIRNYQTWPAKVFLCQNQQKYTVK